ncbi:MAG: PadR family transcriptional regulator [Pirellulales bacterium]
MSERKTNPPFLNGVPELLILELLSRRPMHGYELVQAIRAATAGGLEFGEGCIYPILHRLESQGVLKASRESTAGRVRVVYRVLPKGKAQLARSVGTWQKIVSAINHALQGGERGRQALA